MNDLAINEDVIQNKIYNIRGVQVMLDRDLAEVYRVETKRINEAVKRNVDKFPDDLMFELNAEEYDVLRSQIATLNTYQKCLQNRVFICLQLF